jgi:hypothetical protein
MKSTAKKKPISADEIAEMADRGEDISRFFTNKGRMMPGIKVEMIQRVNVDFTDLMLKELDDLSVGMNISRQAVIKSMLRFGLDQHYMATQKRAPLSQEKAA